MYHRLSHKDARRVAYFYLRGLATAQELSRIYRVTVVSVYRRARVGKRMGWDKPISYIFDGKEGINGRQGLVPEL